MVFIQVEVLGFEWINMISHKYYVKRQYSNCELDFVPDKTYNKQEPYWAYEILVFDQLTVGIDHPDEKK